MAANKCGYCNKCNVNGYCLRVTEALTFRYHHLIFRKRLLAVEVDWTVVVMLLSKQKLTLALSSVFISGRDFHA